MRGRLPVEQPRDDLGPGLGIRGGGEGGERHIERPAQRADAQVVGAEVVTPLADAMRFVDGDQAHADPAQKCQLCRPNDRRSGAM
jgi:hypothetical protein